MKLSKQQKNEIYTLYMEGHQVGEIGEVMGLSKWAVYMTIRNAELIEKRKEESDAKREKAIRSLFYEGKSCLEIAMALNCSEVTVRKYLKQYGLSQNERDMAKEKQQLIELLRTGHTCKEIGEIMGLSESGVFYKIKQGNIDSKKEREYYKKNKE